MSDDSTTMYALIRRHPDGGYAVVVGLVEWSHTPAVDVDTDAQYITMNAAARFAREAGFWSIHPECFRAPTRLIRGAIQ